MKTLLVITPLLWLTSCMQTPDTPFRMSLEGEWRFQGDTLRRGIDEHWYAPSTDRSAWTAVSVPDFWEHYPGMAAYDGWGWFARTVRLASVPADVSLHFAGVDDEATVWVNGQEVGDHTGYTDPFALNVSQALQEGENSVVVLVKDNGGGGGIYRPVTLIETRGLDSLLKGPYSGTPARPSADWVRDAVIYSAYLRSASREGTFAGLERRIPELKAMGVTVLWLLPIHPVGMKDRKGKLGSPYAVRDYYGINPEFGTMEDFRRLLATVHASGMKLIIDLVANHTSWDSRLMKEHPEYFTRDSSGRIVPPNADWTDVADLDYSSASLRTYMMDMMVWWVKEVGIDGFRCDVAEMVPTDFWDEARARLDAIKPVMMLSEGSIPEHHARAFDLTYSWNIYDVLSPLLAARRSVAILDGILRTEAVQFPVGSLRMRFTTNHDKNAWDAPAVRKFSPSGVRLGAVLTFTLSGVPMIYTGEEVSNDRVLRLFDKVPVDWSGDRSMAELYTRLSDLRRAHVALRGGGMHRCGVEGSDHVFAFLRESPSDTLLVVVNFAPASARVSVRAAGLARAPRELTDYITRTSVRPSGDRLDLALERHGVRVFPFRP